MFVKLAEYAVQAVHGSISHAFCVMPECPGSYWTTFGCSLRAKWAVAKVCRTAWKVKPLHRVRLASGAVCTHDSRGCGLSACPRGWENEIGLAPSWGRKALFVLTRTMSP